MAEKMTNLNPKVSIYISTHNRVERLRRAVQSLLDQDYKNIEILICDDASSDGTKEFSEKLVMSESRVRYFRNETNCGACVTRNLGIENASGKFITGLDDDDEFTKDRVSTLLDIWDEKYAFVCTNFLNIYPDTSSVPNYPEVNTLVFDFKAMLFENVASNQIFTLTSRLQAIGGFDPRVKRLQDWDTWLRLSYKFGPFIRMPKCSYLMYHDHAKGEKRVSSSFPFLDALEQLRLRNIDLYEAHENINLRNTILFRKKKLTLIDAIKWCVITKKPKNLAKYFFQPFLKNKFH